LAGAGQVNATDPLDRRAGQSIAGRPAAAARKIGLNVLHATPNVRAETPNVLFSDTGPEDIEANPQLVGRLCT
jgi:hypothetical protein